MWAVRTFSRPVHRRRAAAADAIGPAHDGSAGPFSLTALRRQVPGVMDNALAMVSNFARRPPTYGHPDKRVFIGNHHRICGLSHVWPGSELDSGLQADEHWPERLSMTLLFDKRQEVTHG